MVVNALISKLLLVVIVMGIGFLGAVTFAYGIADALSNQSWSVAKWKIIIGAIMIGIFLVITR